MFSKQKIAEWKTTGDKTSRRQIALQKPRIGFQPELKGIFQPKIVRQRASTALKLRKNHLELVVTISVVYQPHGILSVQKVQPTSTTKI